MKLTFLIFSVLLLFVEQAQAQTYVPRNGDLLFQDMDCGPLCDAIEKVTDGVGGLDFSHMGLVYVTENNAAFVIEAISGSVQMTPLEQFVHRSRDANGNPKVVVAHLPDSLVDVSHQAVRIARAQLGVPYDNAFLPNNGKWYCSELIADAFNKAAGYTLFADAPMTFKDPETGSFFPAWVEYYRELETRIPEGRPGCNPGGMSRAPFLEIELPYSDFGGAYAPR
ncbi:MAG TPA: YiiX/YebB-like N1pC/P60 family cysteine hydrolase [Chitinophagales bacterium]|nr:YiiX/YebB-like N1pC/P60 family cysteine hydrolase [Chitinophagales bacterium]